MRNFKVLFYIPFIWLVILIAYCTSQPQDENTNNRNFNCIGESKTPPSHTTALVISGPPRENYDPLRVQDNELLLEVNKFVLRNCTILITEDFPVLTNLPYLQEMILNDLDLKIFNLAKVADSVRLRTINLDHNPITTLIGDAQISLHHLSLRNTSLKDLPNNEIMKEIKTINVTSDNFLLSHDEVCERYKTLELFNGERCVQTITVPNLKIRDTEIKEPEIAKKENTTSGHKLISANIGLLLLVSMFTLNRSWSITTILIVVATLQIGSVQSATIYNPQKMVHETVLHLESRGILALDYDEFDSTPKLTHLYLANNSLTQLGFNAPNLIHLDVTNNLLWDIRNEDFRLLPSLKKIVLSGNNLTTINWNLNKHDVNNITEIHFSNNPLRKLHIRSEKLKVLAISNTNITDLYMDLPKLRTLVFKNLVYINGMDEICRQHLHMSFVIIYRDEIGYAQMHECNLGLNPTTAEPLEQEVLPSEKPARNVVGCEFSTLRFKVDDIVISKEQYFWLNVVFTAMGCCVLLLSALLLWMLRVLYKDESKAWAPRRTDEFRG